jgi:hypothetical protein
LFCESSSVTRILYIYPSNDSIESKNTCNFSIFVKICANII